MPAVPGTPEAGLAKRPAEPSIGPDHDTFACEGGTCELFGLFGIAVQLLIGVWCFLVLVILWRWEKPRRSFSTWLGDMSKQMVGAAWGHFMNIAMALIFGLAPNGATPANNQCVWYTVGFVSDIIFVTILSWIVTEALRPIVLDRYGIDLGDYEDTHGESEEEEDTTSIRSRFSGLMSWRIWLRQTGIWLGITTFVKVIVCIGVYIAQDIGYALIVIAFRILDLCGHNRMQLLVALVIIPLVGDAFQFAVQDHFLKKKRVGSEARETKYSVAPGETGALLGDGKMLSGEASETDREGAE